MNAYLKKQKELQTQLLNTGMREGVQFAIDMVEIVLHRQGWGYTRIKNLIDQVQEVSDYYADSMHPCMEQDILQEKQDAELRDIIKGNQRFMPFRERHPAVLNAGYEKLPKK